MSTLNAPLIQSHKPASFVERGVAVPFTTPRLAGARIRPAERTGTEFVVPNPSGGRGVYILAWTAVRQLCQPTMHDSLLHQRISRLPIMDPAGIRGIARQLAAEGLAGSEAAGAAAAVAEADRRDLTLMNFLLLITLMEQEEPTGLRVNAETQQTPELDRRARSILARVAAGIGRNPVEIIGRLPVEEIGGNAVEVIGGNAMGAIKTNVARISDDLRAIAGLFVPVGLNAPMAPARWPRLAARLEAAATQLSLWAEQHRDDDGAGLAASLGRSAALTAGCGAACLTAARARAGDIRGLLREWAAAPNETARYLSRADWILDGWEHFCLLWEAADHVSVQRAVLREMAQLVPMLPREAADWGLERIELEQQEPALRAASLNAAWRGGGAAQGLIARNEHLHGLLS